MKVVDLYCGIGGSAIGIKKAILDADIHGYDIRNYSYEYPFTFHRQDITQFDILPDADFYWASPPCQAYSITTKGYQRSSGKTYPTLIEFTRDKLLETGKPFIIENVMQAPLIESKTIILRGHNFEDLCDMRRPRKFEIHGFVVPQPPEYKKIFPFYRLISGGGGWITDDEKDKVLRMTIAEANKRFHVKGQTMWDVAQIIPWQYSHYLCKHLLWSIKSDVRKLFK